jgi:hypothetical protein
LEILKLSEKIWVFRGAIENPQSYIDYYTTDPINLDRWTPWYTFGDMIGDSGTSWKLSESFPSKKEWTENFLEEPDLYKRKIADAFYDASKIYLEEANVNFPNWISPNWGIARYFPDVADFETPENQGRTMVHHSDYQQELADYPGEKFAVTAVLYLNDDYEGGEINFRLTGPNDHLNVVEEIVYKPVAGDMLFFPSTPPYYHGVLNVKKNPKYIVRLYWKYYEESSETYLNLKKRYGDDFEEVDMVRRKRKDMFLSDPVHRPRMSMAEYYEKLHNGTLKEDYNRD